MILLTPKVNVMHRPWRECPLKVSTILDVNLVPLKFYESLTLFLDPEPTHCNPDHLGLFDVLKYLVDTTDRDHPEASVQKIELTHTMEEQSEKHEANSEENPIIILSNDDMTTYDRSWKEPQDPILLTTTCVQKVTLKIPQRLELKPTDSIETSCSNQTQIFHILGNIPLAANVSHSPIPESLDSYDLRNCLLIRAQVSNLTFTSPNSNDEVCLGWNFLDHYQSFVRDGNSPKRTFTNEHEDLNRHPYDDIPKNDPNPQQSETDELADSMNSLSVFSDGDSSDSDDDTQTDDHMITTDDQPIQDQEQINIQFRESAKTIVLASHYVVHLKKTTTTSPDPINKLLISSKPDDKRFVDGLIAFAMLEKTNRKMLTSEIIIDNARFVAIPSMLAFAQYLAQPSTIAAKNLKFCLTNSPNFPSVSSSYFCIPESHFDGLYESFINDKSRVILYEDLGSMKTHVSTVTPIKSLGVVLEFVLELELFVWPKILPPNIVHLSPTAPGFPKKVHFTCPDASGTVNCEYQLLDLSLLSKGYEELQTEHLIQNIKRTKLRDPESGSSNLSTQEQQSDAHTLC